MHARVERTDRNSGFFRAPGYDAVRGRGLEPVFKEIEWSARRTESGGGSKPWMTG
jgi:hypothetical protein